MRNEILRRYAFPALLAALVLHACNDSTTFGLDLLQEDTTKVGFTDSLTLQSATLPGDLADVYSPFTAASAYLLGQLDDPIFGKSSSSIFMQFLPRQSIFFDFKEKTVDSVVLVLPYDTTVFYGNLSAPLSLSVHALVQAMDRTETYKSNTVFASENLALGTVTVIPSTTSTQVFDYRLGTVDTLRFPHIRIRIDKPSFLKPFTLADSTVYNADADFFRFFAGLALKPSGDGKAMVGINLQSSNAGLYFYYRSNNSPGQFQYVTNGYSAKISSFVHSSGNSPAQIALGRSFSADASPIFSQGMAGVQGALRVTDLARLKGKIINFAELELYAQTLPGDNASYYPPAPQVILHYRDASGKLVVTSDVTLAGENIGRYVGGRPIPASDGNPVKYRVNLSSHLNRMIEGKLPPELYIRVFPRAERASRTVFFGAGHPRFGARMKVTYTDFPR